MTTMKEVMDRGQQVRLKCNNCGHAAITVTHALFEALSMRHKTTYVRDMLVEDVSRSTRCVDCGSKNVASMIATPESIAAQDTSKPCYLVCTRDEKGFRAHLEC